MHPSIDAERVIAAVQRDDCSGFCHSCGQDAEEVEPDARNYECEHCQQKQVFGAEETLLHLA